MSYLRPAESALVARLCRSEASALLAEQARRVEPLPRQLARGTARVVRRLKADHPEVVHSASARARRAAGSSAAPGCECDADVLRLVRTVVVAALRALLL